MLQRLTQIDIWGADQQRAEYAYDMSGIRTRKIVEDKRHDYVTQNGKVVRELVTNTYTGTFLYCLDFFYDAAGRPYAMRKYTDAALTTYGTYYYLLNAQGDVVGLLNSSGTLVVKYAYDAWGKLLTATDASGNAITSSTHIANVNPLRYRGYYYDTETGWYYLQSRYYDPIVKRFLNADAYASTGQGFLGYNMFAYCNNLAVMLTDCEGKAGAISLTINRLETDTGGGGGGGVVALGIIYLLTVLLYSDSSNNTSSSSSVDPKTKPTANNATVKPATSTPATPPNNNNNHDKRDYLKARTNRIANEWAKRAGWESAEDLKGYYVGKSNAAKFDIFLNKETNMLVLIEKTTGVIVETAEHFLW